MEVVYELGSQMIVFAEITDTKDKAKQMMADAISSKKALNKLIELVENQNGDSSYIFAPEKFETAKFAVEYKALSSGYIKCLKAEAFGIASMTLGGGRETFEDVIDMSVGIILNKKVGEYVNAGDTIFTIHSNSKEKTENALEVLEGAVEISTTPCEKNKTIIDIIT